MLGIGNNFKTYRYKGNNILRKLIDALKIRAIEDGGIFEANNCLK